MTLYLIMKQQLFFCIPNFYATSSKNLVGYFPLSDLREFIYSLYISIYVILLKYISIYKILFKIIINTTLPIFILISLIKISLWTPGSQISMTSLFICCSFFSFPFEILPFRHLKHKLKSLQFVFCLLYNYTRPNTSCSCLQIYQAKYSNMIKQRSTGYKVSVLGPNT